MADCTTATYTALSDGLIEVKNRAWYWWTFFNYYQVEGKAKVRSPGNLYVNFGDTSDMDKDPNYKVLMTDYIGYTVVYSC